MLLQKRDWDLLSVGASVEKYSQGDIIIDENLEIGHLYFINSGRCSLEIRGHIVASLTENDFFGEGYYLKISQSENEHHVLTAESQR